MKQMRTYPLLLALLLLMLVGCRGSQPHESRPVIYVSIAPLKGVVERIVGDDFAVKVLVPAGASPETFEPTPRQFVALNNAHWLFAVGLIDFEQELLHRLDGKCPIVPLHEGIELIGGSCSHHHTHHNHPHTHGIDPHIWTSPRALGTMSAAIFKTIQQRYPDSLHYQTQHARLQEDISSLDQRIADRLAAAEVSEFLIYHPALTYYARDYGLRQTAIEEEGKEPSARHISELIRRARRAGLRTVLYQRQYPRSSVEAIASEIEAEAVEFDPLSEDILDEIDRITTLITRP